jgi:hypothetical protein
VLLKQSRVQENGRGKATLTSICSGQSLVRFSAASNMKLFQTLAVAGSGCTRRRTTAPLRTFTSVEDAKASANALVMGAKQSKRKPRRYNSRENGSPQV